MIRKCTLDDEKIWLELNIEFMKFEYQDENVWENPLSKGDPAEIFKEVLSNPDSANQLYLVEEKGKVIGFINTASFLSIWAHGNVAFIDDYFIKEQFRGKGYGKKNLDELAVILKEQGFKRIQLMAEETNPGAVAFYHKAGYSQQKLNFFCKYL